MSNIFALENLENLSDKLNIDDLYEKKRLYDLNTLTLFKKMLNSVHQKIKTASRQKRDEQMCWYLVPEIILGVPKYDQGACIAYLMDKLKTNGFNVRYVHPNVLFISWYHLIPSYIRTEFKNKTGIKINEFGVRVADEEEEDTQKAAATNDILKQQHDGQKAKKEYTPIKSYKPSGQLVYDNELLNKIETKFV